MAPFQCYFFCVTEFFTSHRHEWVRVRKTEESGPGEETPTRDTPEKRDDWTTGETERKTKNTGKCVRI